MNKREYAEFHKYLAMIIYEYNEILVSTNISDETREEVGKMLEHLFEVMKICLIDDVKVVDDNE